jgi:16S rRNA (guanine527-N7)-methyltransferase
MFEAAAGLPGPDEASDMASGTDSGADQLARFDVSRESRARLEAFVDLLVRWQKRINLIGPATVADVWQRHIADAVQLVPLIRPHVRRVLDLGSGAGIPGVVIAIVLMDRQAAEVHLVESTGKKAAFLRQAVQLTGAPAVVHNCRVEALARAGEVRDVDLVTARALAPLPKLLQLASAWLEAGAYGLFHKGQDVDSELTESAKSWRITYAKHPSVVDPGGCILEVKEIEHVS